MARRLQFSEALCASANRHRFDLRRAAPFFLMHSYLTPHLFPESPASLPPSATPRAQRAKPLLEKNDHNSRNAFKKQVFVWSAAALIFAAAIAVRLAHLDGEPFWVDEAESSINALTILEHAYPTDTYLGLPIYENTSVQPWPGNPEYALRDVSYSDNHFAVYHGWLPLYSIAASFAAYGIRPDAPKPPYAIRHDVANWKRQTLAARMPGVLFGLMFVIVVFAAGKMLYGDDAAWSGLILASVHPLAISVSRQARYYSAEVLLTTVCCVLAWLMICRGRWKDFICGGFAFVLLFHTHFQAFFAGGLTVAIATPIILRLQARSVRKLAAFGAIVLAGTIPWLIATHFHAHFYAQPARLPRAWALLQFPGDLLRYPPFAYCSMLFGALFASATGWAVVRPTTETLQRITAPLRKAAPALAFHIVWILCGYTSFLATIPVVSFASGRLNLSYWGPALVLFSVASAAIARMIPWRVPRAALAPAVTLTLYLAMGHSLTLSASYSDRGWRIKSEAIQELELVGFDSKTRFYASPNRHLIWTIYTGLPVQSIVPVRKEYLNSYKGDIIYIDSFSEENEILCPERIRDAARRKGLTLSNKSAEVWSRLLLTHDYRETLLRQIGVGADKQIEPIPDFSEALLNASRERARTEFETGGLELITRGAGIDIRSWQDWRTAFFSRFAEDPAFRPHAPVNYSERLRGSDAVILEDSGAGIAIYKSRWHPSGKGGTINFSISSGRPRALTSSVVFRPE